MVKHKWDAIISDLKASELNPNQYATRHQISKTSLYYHLRKRREPTKQHAEPRGLVHEVYLRAPLALPSPRVADVEGEGVEALLGRVPAPRLKQEGEARGALITHALRQGGLLCGVNREHEAVLTAPHAPRVEGHERVTALLIGVHDQSLSLAAPLGLNEHAQLDEGAFLTPPHAPCGAYVAVHRDEVHRGAL